MAKRTRNRMELREQYDAAERQTQEGEADETEEVEDEDEEEEEAEAEAEAEPGAEAPAAEDDEDEDEGGDDDDEDAPKKKKKKKVVKPPKVVKPKAKPRTRVPKIVRMRVIWGVFNNSNQRVAVFDYPKKKEAYEKAAQLTTDKKQTHFVQPVKEPIEEKKEKE